MKKLVTVLAVSAVLFAGCAKKGDTTSSNVVVKVDGKSITKSDIDKKLKGILPMVKMQKRNFSSADSVKLVKDIVDMEVLVDVILNEAKTDAGLSVADSIVKKEVEKSKAKYFQGNDSIMNVRLAANHQTVKDFKKDLKTSLIVDKFFKRASASLTVDSAEISKYFAANKSDFIKYPTSHILIMPKPDSTIGIKEADSIALAKITLIADSLKSGKAKFEDLAKNNSDGPSSKNGGNLGSGSVKNWAPKFGEAVLKLKAGEVSGIVKTQFGYHIIKLNGKPTDSLSMRDKMVISSKIKKAKMDKVIKDIKAKHDIKEIIKL